MIKLLKTKILLTTLILIPFNSLAEHTPYFKGVFGINKFNKLNNFNNLKQVSNYSPELGVGGGVGYNFDETFRGELLVTHTKISFHNYNKLMNFYEFQLSTQKVTINSIMFNIHKDFITIMNNVTFFAGVGVGISQINEVIIWETMSPSNMSVILNKGNIHRKTVYNFTHTVIGGLDFNVSNRINIEITYQYKNHGHTKHKAIYKMNLDQKNYINHSLYTGIRYKL